MTSSLISLIAQNKHLSARARECRYAAAIMTLRALRCAVVQRRPRSFGSATRSDGELPVHTARLCLHSARTHANRRSKRLATLAHAHCTSAVSNHCASNSQDRPVGLYLWQGKLCVHARTAQKSSRIVRHHCAVACAQYLLL